MAGPKKAVIDTNLLVRYLTDDDPHKAKAVADLLKSASRGELKILVPSIAAAELVWVLESFYRLEPTVIAELIEAVLNTPGVEVTEKSLIANSLSLYKAGNMDFIDAWILSFAQYKNVKTVFTYDRKHFKNIEDVEITEP